MKRTSEPGVARSAGRGTVGRRSGGFDIFVRFAVVAFAAGLASPSLAQSPPPDDAIKLGIVRGFPDEATAREACRPDGVVWADRRTGYYYPRFAPEYGTGPTGTFTCYRQAKQADYWSTGGTSDALAGRPTRVFPINPEPFCDYKVDKRTGKGFCAQPGA